MIAQGDLLNYFLVTHEKYCHPDIVLQEDNISIFACDVEKVIFSFTPPEVAQEPNRLVTKGIFLFRLICTIYPSIHSIRSLKFLKAQSSSS